MARRLYKYGMYKWRKLNKSNKTFEDLFFILHDQKDNVLFEYDDNNIEHKIKYSEFKEYCYKMATFLDSQIDEPKDSFVGIYLNNSANWLACYWALLMIGYKPLLINLRLSDELNNNVLKMIKCKTIITNDRLADANLNANKIVLDYGLGLDNSITKLEPIKETTWASEFALTSTATTLNVKVCIYNQESLANELLNMKTIMRRNKEVTRTYNGVLKQLSFLPLYHIFGLIASCLWFVLGGCTLVLIDKYEADTILSTVRKHHITHIFAVPLLWHSISRETTREVSEKDEKTQYMFNKAIKITNALGNISQRAGRKFARKYLAEVQNKTLGDSVCFAISGGGYISSEALKTINGIGYPLFNGYGTSETSITSVELTHRMSKRLKGSVGKPFDSVEYKIENSELFIRGKTLARKIIDSKQVTVINPSIWFRTGDLALEYNGSYFIKGRKDDLYVGYNGEKINPDSLERRMHFKYISDFSIIKTKVDETTKLVLIIKINKEISNDILYKIKKDVKVNIDKVYKYYHIHDVFYTYDDLWTKGDIKVSRKRLGKWIEDNQIKLYKLDDLDNN